MKKCLIILLSLIIIILGFLYYKKDKKCDISEIDVIKLNNFFSPSLVWDEKYWCEIKKINFRLGVNWKEIIPEIWKLSNLEILILNDKKLSGQIPKELWDLKNLESLWLNDNDLSGKIPENIKNLKNLKSLTLWNNKLLIWWIPKELLEQLDRLWIQNTNLTIGDNISKNIKYLNK